MVKMQQATACQMQQHYFILVLRAYKKHVIAFKYLHMRQSVKLFTFLIFFCMNCFGVKAQQKHFIYVQSEDKQPFAVVLGGKVYSSSDYGYVIIPKLTDSTYKFTVSFPMNKFPDQIFTCTVSKKDAGYALKNETDGWVLQNMQTQKLLVNNTAAVAQKNAFGDMLSDVVNDSLLTKNTALQKPADTIKTVTDTIAEMQAPIDTIAENSISSITDSTNKPEKISESKLDTGTSMLFVDKTQNGVDTINVFVPAEKNNDSVITAQQSLPDTATSSSILPAIPINTDTLQNNNVTSSASQKNSDTSALENSTANNKETQDTTTHAVSNPFYKPEQNANNIVINSAATATNETSAVNVSNTVKQDCGNMVSDDDLNKLKRKMFIQKSDDGMIQYAVKFVGKKCITTDQVKLLGELFSSDDGRYTLYDALYKYVYDYGNYATLITQILDPYYKKRFAAMLR
jgi:hypothetical protein